MVIQIVSDGYLIVISVMGSFTVRMDQMKMK